jgi:hypothetical protein
VAYLASRVEQAYHDLMKGPKGIVKAHMPKTYRSTPKRPALHVGYRSCGFMQRMRQKGVTTIGIDPYLFDGVDQFGRPTHQLHPVCKEYYDTQQLSQRVLSNTVRPIWVYPSAPAPRSGSPDAGSGHTPSTPNWHMLPYALTASDALRHCRNHSATIRCTQWRW